MASRRYSKQPGGAIKLARSSKLLGAITVTCFELGIGTKRALASSDDTDGPLYGGFGGWCWCWLIVAGTVCV